MSDPDHPSPSESRTHLVPSPPPMFSAADSHRLLRGAPEDLPSPTTPQDPEEPEGNGMTWTMDEWAPPLGLESAEPAPTARTATSTAGSGDPRTVGAALAVLLGVASMLAARAVARRWTLRTPTHEQSRAIADPAARIACRHLPMAALGPDVTDAVEIAAAVSDYATDGPLLTTRATPTLEDTPDAA